MNHSFTKALLIVCGAALAVVAWTGGQIGPAGLLAGTTFLLVLELFGLF